MNAERLPAERLIWESYPAWSQFSWLYLISLLVALRGALYLRFGIPGGEAWLIGAFALLLCAAVLRRWARYELTSARVIIRNGYTGREIGAIGLERIADVEVRQGPIAHLFGIGTVVIKAEGERLLRLRGIRDPEAIRIRIEAMRPAAAS